MSDDQDFGGHAGEDFASEAMRGSEAQGAFLDDQRANVRECKPPSLGRLNGVGTGMYGRSSPADDGTYIKTLAFSVFWVPVFPIAQYLVSDAEDKGWYFHGKVPMSESAKGKRRGVLALAALAVLMVAIFIFKAGSEADVHVVNGLDVALDIRLGEEALRVEPGQVRKVEVSAGALHVSAITPEGYVVDERDVDVPGRADAVVYNPLGAAAVHRRAVVYAFNATEQETSAAEHMDIPTGAAWQVYEDADHVFEPTPDEVEIPRGKNVATRMVVDQAEGGWWRTASWWLERNRSKEAARLAAAAATVPPIDSHAVTTATTFADLADEPALAESLTPRATELAPDDFDVALLHQSVLLRSRRPSALTERFRTQHAADPSEKNTMLLARLLPLGESRAIYEAGLENTPGSPWLHASYAHSLSSNGFFEESIPHYRVVVDQPRHVTMLSDLATALTAMGDAEGALNELDARLAKMEPHQLEFDVLPVYQRNRVLHPGIESKPVSAFLPPEGSDAAFSTWGRAMLAAEGGDAAVARELAAELEDEPRALIEITVLTAQDLDSAVAAARALVSAGPEPLVQLGDLTKVQLAAEFVRSGDTALVDILFNGLSGFARTSLKRELLDDLPQLPAREVRLPAHLRAALVHAAARRTDDADVREALLARARALDPLRRVLPAD